MAVSAPFEKVRSRLEELGFRIQDENTQKPWGGYFVIDESQSTKFSCQFFTGTNVDISKTPGKMSPKILMVAPGKRLSWQYHHRRSEIWRCLVGPVGLIRSSTNKEGPLVKVMKGETVRLAQGERHRLIGLKDWGIMAEIWIHTEPNHPSDENDIVRLKDDFKRI